MLRIALLAICLAILIIPASHDTVAAPADGPEWSMKVITFGKTRQSIKSQPIHMRPNRPLHFYGNRQRRSYHRRQIARTNRPTNRTAPAAVKQPEPALAKKQENAVIKKQEPAVADKEESIVVAAIPPKKLAAQK